MNIRWRMGQRWRLFAGLLVLAAIVSAYLLIRSVYADVQYYQTIQTPPQYAIIA